MNLTIFSTDRTASYRIGLIRSVSYHHFDGIILGFGYQRLCLMHLFPTPLILANSSLSAAPIQD